MTDPTIAPRKPTWGWWEPGTVALMRRVVRPGWTVFDFGAHVGYYSTLLSELVGSEGAVHAFEPHPGNRDVLRGNLRGSTNVTVVPRAVSDRIERRPFHFSSNTGRHSLFESSFMQQDGMVVEVECTTIDAYWASIGRPTVELLKIDVEGAEVLAMSGAVEMLNRCPDITIVSEFYPENLRNAGSGPAEYLALLAGLGLSIQTILDDGSLRPGVPELSGDDYVNVCLRRSHP